jgi:hypothetical protein
MIKLSQYFWSLVEQLPSLITMIGCIVFALMRRKRHPKVSLMVVVSLGLLVLHVFVFMLVYDLVPDWMSSVLPKFFGRLGAVLANRRDVYLVLGVISNGAAAVAFALLLAGVFMQRKPDALSEPRPG